MKSQRSRNGNRNTGWRCASTEDESVGQGVRCEVSKDNCSWTLGTVPLTLNCKAPLSMKSPRGCTWVVSVRTGKQCTCVTVKGLHPQDPAFIRTSFALWPLTLPSWVFLEECERNLPEGEILSTMV